MENLIITQISVSELREIVREELRNALNEKKHTPEIQIPEILNVSQAAKFLNRSIDSIYKLTAKKIIPHYNPSGKLLVFKKSELIAWLETGKVKTNAENARELNDQLKNQRRR